MLRQGRNIYFLAKLIMTAAVFAQAAQAAPMSPAEMTVILREAKVVGPTVRLDVIESDQHVTVITKRSPNMLDRDCKITAVLMAKALMDARPKELAAVKVIYTKDGENTVSKVMVSAGDVQSFAQGTITESQLLGSLELTKESEDGSDSQAPKAAGLVSGPLRERREIVRSRIAALKEGGTGVAPFEKILNQIEDLTSNGREKDAAQLLSDLSAKLTEQESLRDQAKRVAEGRGVKGHQGTSWTGNKDANLGNNKAGAAQNSGYQSVISGMKSRLKKMNSEGIQTSDMEQKLGYLEQQSSKMAPDALMKALDEIKAAMSQASRAQNPNLAPLFKKWQGQ